MPPDLVATRMSARSRVATDWRVLPDGSGHTRISRLHAEAPLMLKATYRKEPEPWPQLTARAARVLVTAGAAGPIGGDSYRLDVEVGEGSALVLGDVSPTLLLPGPGGAASSHRVDVEVQALATLIWLAEPVIAAHGCNHSQTVTVLLHPSARLVMREELILGRHGETCGSVRQRIIVRRGATTLYRQDLAVGPDAPGYDGAAVLDGGRAVGSVLVVDPAWELQPRTASCVSPTAATLPLAGPATLATGVAADNLALRASLNSGLAQMIRRPAGPADSSTRQGDR